MLKDYTVRGVPQSIAMDAWWMGSETSNGTASGQGKVSELFLSNAARWGKATGGLVLLVLLGDHLFWEAQPGFSLAVFAVAVFAVAVFAHRRWDRAHKSAILMVAAILPIVEHVQMLSVGILAIGTLCAIGSLTLNKDDSAQWVAAAAMKLLEAIPSAGILAFLAQLQHLKNLGRVEEKLWTSRSRAIWRNWSFPAGGALILGSLLISANPVLERFVVELFDVKLPNLPSLQRMMFWSGLGLLVWPLINPPRPARPLAITGPSQRISMGLNAGSVLRALLVFNGFLLVQSFLDLSILFAGAALPENMSYATYAHRGAYPLLATAMLAGAFTFAAQPFLHEHGWIKPLLLMWVAQNVLLTLSSVLRLDLYISEYGLTYLRIYALIWMALVAAGLLITLWHVLHGRAALLLFGRLCALGFGTLYLCSFVNFAAIIATHSIERAADPETRITDFWYVCALGPTADKAIAEGLARYPDHFEMNPLRNCHSATPRSSDWRELDLRTLRTRG